MCVISVCALANQSGALDGHGGNVDKPATAPLGVLGAGAAMATWTACDSGARVSDSPSDVGGGTLLVDVDDSTVGEAGEGDVDRSGCDAVSVEDAS
jgi:hypothetical protein